MSLLNIIVLLMWLLSLLVMGGVMLKMWWDLKIVQARAEIRAEVIAEIRESRGNGTSLTVVDGIDSYLSTSIQRTEQIETEIRECVRHIHDTCDQITAMFEEIISELRLIRIAIEERNRLDRMALPLAIRPDRLLSVSQPEFSTHIDIEFQRLTE